MEISATDTDKYKIIKLSGKITWEDAQDLDTRVRRFIEEEGFYHLVFNMDEVSFICSGGIGALVFNLNKVKEKEGGIYIVSANEYFNYIWFHFKFQDPCFPNGAQFGLRYMGYLCAPGFLIMNGAMVYWAFLRRLKRGDNPWHAKWDFIQRGLFLIAVQLVWVNSSWSGFARLRLDHFGIIATIGTSMILLSFLIRVRW